MAGHLHGLDRAAAPDAATAKKMLDAIDGHWWNVYIGGHTAGSGWTAERLEDYVRHGVRHFMLTYVSQLSAAGLTAAQGEIDARDALGRARKLGFSGNIPLCLDVEGGTYHSHPKGAVAYSRAWCDAVRKAGARPGLYSNPAPLKGLHDGGVKAEFVWIASFVTTSASHRDPYDAASNMERSLWSEPGRRAWQYGGIIGGKPCRVLSLDVDISVADPACLAPPPGQAAATTRPARPLRRGDRGAPVVRLTRRLSTVRSRQTGRPYLDGARKHFDAETEVALKAFQAEHKLEAKGLYGPRTAKALHRAAVRERERRQDAPAKVPAGPMHLLALVRDFQRLDAAADRAWQRLDAYGEARLRQLARADEDQDGLGGITEILTRMEHQLGTLVDLERRELAEDEAVEIAAPVEVAPEPSIAPIPDHPAPPPPPEPEPRRVPLRELSDPRLEKTIERLDLRLDHARKERLGRFARAEKKLHPATGKPAVKAGPAHGPKHHAKPDVHAPKHPQKPKHAGGPAPTVSRADIVKRALTHDGYVPHGGRSDPFTAFLHRPIEAWCGDFVTAIYAMSGLRLPPMQPGSPTGFWSVPMAWDWARAHGHTVSSWEAKPGDIVCIDWTGAGTCNTQETHCGIVVEWSGGALRTVEGNSTADRGVNRRTWDTPAGTGHRQIAGVIDVGRLVDFAHPNARKRRAKAKAGRPVKR